MKHFLLILALLITPFTLFAANDGLSKSKGTTQDVIVQFTPSPAQEDVSRNKKIEVTFSVPLDAKHIKKHDIKLRCLSCKKKKKIKGLISYIEVEKKLTFTPKASLEPGMYEVEIKSLKADKAHKDTKINEIKYQFIVIKEVLQSITLHPSPIEIKEGEYLQFEVMGHYDTGVEKDISTQIQWSITDSQIVTVDANATLKALKEGTTSVTAKIESVEVSTETTVYKEINGHRLPPEPDKTVNDSTLLGIDTNNNNVRDDVERWIYETYKDKHPIHIDIAMQAGRAYTQVLKTPERAKEIRRNVSAPVYCEGYFMVYAAQFGGINFIKERIIDKIEIKIFNTKDRGNEYLIYQKELSGDSYTVPWPSEGKEYCDFNISKYKE